MNNTPLSNGYLLQQLQVAAERLLEPPTQLLSNQTLEDWVDAQDIAVRAHFVEGVPRGMRSMYRAIFLDPAPLSRDAAKQLRRRLKERYLDPSGADVLEQVAVYLQLIEWGRGRSRTLTEVGRHGLWGNPFFHAFLNRYPKVADRMMGYHPKDQEWIACAERNMRAVLPFWIKYGSWAKHLSSPKRGWYCSTLLLTCMVELIVSNSPTSIRAALLAEVLGWVPPSGRWPSVSGLKPILGKLLDVEVGLVVRMLARKSCGAALVADLLCPSNGTDEDDCFEKYYHRSKTDDGTRFAQSWDHAVWKAVWTELQLCALDDQRAADVQLNLLWAAIILKATEDPVRRDQ